MNLSGIFQDEIERLEQLYLFSPWLSEMYAQTLVEAAFLSLVMDQMVDIDFLRTVNSILVDNILERFPENLQQIASQWHNIIEGGVKSHSFLEACLMTIVDFKLLKGNGFLWCLSIWLPLSPFHRPSRSLGYPCGQGSIRVRSQCRTAVLCGNRRY